MHVVREGDTLWDLASFYLTDPFLWPEIYRLNTVVVEDPHWIYPAEELVVPGPAEIGREVPVVERVPGEEVVERLPVPELTPDIPVAEVTMRSIFAAPELTRETLTYHTISPVAAIAVSESDFYRAGILVPLEELGPRGEVVDVAAPAGVATRPLETIPRYGRIYLSHLGGEPPDLGQRVMLFRVERRVQPWGHVVRPTGMATIAAVYEDVSVAVVTELYDRVLIGNQAMQAERFEFERGVFPEPVPTGPTGELIALMDPQQIASTEDFVFIDVGRSQGVVVGDEFELYAPGRRDVDGRGLPEEHIGVGRVLRVTEETATLRLIQMRHPTVNVGLPVRLVRRMPS
jgi:hypothetical protein